MCDRVLINSSLMPSEKYSCCGSPLMFTNGSTATECGGGEKAALAGAAGVALGRVDVTRPVVAGGAADPCPRLHGLLISSHASAAATSAATVTCTARRKCTDLSDAKGRRTITG